MLLYGNHLSFTAKFDNPKVQLNWSTVEEQNGGGYVIERSVNGQTFDSIGFVPVVKSNTFRYTFTDHKPIMSRNTYRLRQLSMNGKITYSYTQTVLVNRAFTAHIYPNPVNESSVLTINSSKNDKVGLQLFDSAGKLVWTQQMDLPAGINQMHLPAHDLSSGIYVMVISTSTGTNQLRFVK
jgi:hypothetical protein